MNLNCFPPAMDSGGDPTNHSPNLLKRAYFDDHEEEFPSSGAPIQEAEPLVIPPNFPEDLIVEILLRLPAKSLARFQTVSRSWFSLIFRPDFVETHLAIASRRDGSDHLGLVFTMLSPNLGSQLKWCSVNSLVYPSNAAANFTTRTVIKSAATPSRKSSFRVVGSCNGLVCISVAKGKELILWNPCTKRVKRVHDYDKIGLSRKSYEMDKAHVRYDTFGFGYDELNEDYKVVGMCIKLNDTVPVDGRLPYVAGVRVYSIKNDSWRSVGVYKDVVPSGFFSGILASGNLHWVASCHGDNNWFFLSFDLASETYGEIRWPGSNKVPDDWSVGVLGGCLSVLYSFGDINVDVWVMKEYGVKDSWTKIASVPQIYSAEEFVSYVPVCLLRDGEILLVINSMLALYSPTTNRFRWFPEMNKVEEVSIFIESLVCPYLNEGEQSLHQLNTRWRK